MESRKNGTDRLSAQGSNKDADIKNRLVGLGREGEGGMH